MAANLLFSEDQIKGIREKFSTFDTDKNGTISCRFLIEALMTVGGYLKQTRDRDWDSGLDEIINKFQSDRKFEGEETIEFSEFLTMVAEQTTNTTRLSQYYAAFAAADKNGDRVLSADELHKALSTADPPMTKEDIDALFNKADLNKDGKINMYEFILAIKASFEDDK
ncbi:calcium-binding protein SPEC 1A [Strongylocentrotus purpuratus]|uniref:EF-hand domain-containing protein n=1 Tax=Strongylocentrotus purpuratus TaxID=7668 RepID=A0A7M7RGJ0_STRPU|nr:calcium-binding protein SPEC 1A [Strongylocentrotus purpuratus]|eukprot:XP_790768.1 PREDICTED: calcium-binding protein SPEC 1A [Strongylocentrotus purpuratus]